MSMVAFFILSYVVFQRMLDLKNPKFYVSFFLANLPFVTTITAFIVFAMAVRSRFVFINDIFDQMRLQTPTNVYLYETESLENSERKIFTISKYNKTTISTTSSTSSIYKDTRSLYEKINDVISSKSVVKKFKIDKTTNNKEIKQHIDRLIHLHSKLCDCVTMANELLSFKLLLATIYMFVFIVFACFTGYR